jgi:hypothetical protein
MNLLFADNPNQDGFSAACYHKDLEPLWREKSLKGRRKDRRSLSVKQMKSGQLKITPGLTLQNYGTRYDSAASKLKRLRYVVYMPWASKSTGLPEVPRSSNHPWIMNSEHIKRTL